MSKYERELHVRWGCVGPCMVHIGYHLGMPVGSWLVVIAVSGFPTMTTNTFEHIESPPFFFLIEQAQYTPAIAN